MQASLELLKSPSLSSPFSHAQSCFKAFDLPLSHLHPSVLTNDLSTSAHGTLFCSAPVPLAPLPHPLSLSTSSSPSSQALPFPIYSPNQHLKELVSGFGSCSHRSWLEQSRQTTINQSHKQLMDKLDCQRVN